jgi:SNF2 family DNA or RNA helicase/intein/homing endonuclease
MSEDKTIESKALTLLREYEGANNYIIELKRKLQTNKKFYPTRNQSEYIIHNHNKEPKIARKWILIDPYFANKFANDKCLIKVPNRLWVEKLLAEKEKAYHIWGKFFEEDKLQDIWVPKVSIIKDNTVKDVIIDFEKYSHRPPLEHQKEAIQKLVENKKFILADDMGLGKAQVTSAIVFTPNGKKKIGDLVIGDKIIGSDGKPYNVTGIFPQGEKETFKITFNDGYSVLCCGEHLWSVSSPNYGHNRKNNRIKKSLVLSTNQMYYGGKITIKGNGYNDKKSYNIDTYYKSSNGNNKWQIPIVKPIEFNNSDTLPIEPYLFGLALGDGSFSKKTIKFSQHKDDFDELFENIKIKENKPVSNTRVGVVNVGNSLFDLGVEHTRSYDKFIPDIYKYSSIENRLSLLQGLMDTDGHCMISKNGSFCGTEFSTISEKLCDDVCEIVQTLGGIVRKKTRKSFYIKNGVKVECNISYRVNIKLPKGMNPFRLKRKSERYNEPQKYPTGRYIKNIEKYGVDECVCISVDAPDSLYVTEHCIVTHNTTSTIIAALETGAKKILIVCPATLKINWKREIENYTDRSTYIAEGKKFSSEEDFVIVNYDIIKNFHDPKDKENSLILNSNFDLVILDECFTYDTKISTEFGEINIGDIVENSLDVKVLTYNTKTGEIEYKKINRWIKKNKNTIYKIKFNNGLFIECTENHKFYVKDKGYVRANKLTKNDDLFMLSKTTNKTTNSEKNKKLFEELWFKNGEQKSSDYSKRKTISEKMSMLWQNYGVYNSEKNGQENILFNSLFRKNKIKHTRNKRKKAQNNRKKWWMVKSYEKSPYDESTYGKNVVRKNEKKQSYEEFGEFGKNENKIKRKDFFIERGKWENNNTTRNFTQFVRRWMVYGISNTYKRSYESIQKFTSRLQSRYWESNKQDCGGSGWKYPQNEEMEIFGQEKNKSIEFVRVDSIEILEQGSYDKSTNVCSKNTRVYDLEIEDNHNYFANNILVSNCHYIKNAQALRTKLINSFVSNIERLWLLTGTPMTSRPIDYYNLLNLVDSPVAKNWMAYVIRYCAGYQFKAGNRKVWNVMGASNLEELRDRTSSTILRRLKENVLDLPDKIISPVYLKLKSKEYENVMGEYYDWYDKNPEESKSLTVQFTKLTKVRQIIANEKVAQTIELAENIIEQGKKVIIFCNFTDSLDMIHHHFGKSAVKLDGSMSKQARQLSVDEFQNNEKIKVFVGNIKAAGVGITLTAAEAVIFNDLSFLPSDHAQAEDRSYRYGQKNNVLVYYPLFDNTIEGIIYDILNEKKKVIATVMGDNLDVSDTAELIMNRINELRK